MKVKIVGLVRVEVYKGHTIRRLEDEVGNERVTIDCPWSEYELETSPVLKKESEWKYASVADAKRAINGEQMKFIPVDMLEVIGDKYLNRFKK